MEIPAVRANLARRREASNPIGDRRPGGARTASLEPQTAQPIRPGAFGCGCRVLSVRWKPGSMSRRDMTSRPGQGERVTSIRLDIAIEETAYGAPSEWRMLCAEGKSDNIIELCSSIPRARCDRILEVGAGEGSILQCLDRKKFGKKLHALEISASGVAIIRNRDIKTLASCEVFDGYHIPFDDDTFDLVILSHVLEHVEFPRALLRELHRVSAYHYVEVPLDRPGDSMQSAVMLSYGHVDCFSPSRLRHLLLSEGLLPVAESVKKYQGAAMEYLHFEGRGVSRTPETLAAFRGRYAATLGKFDAMDASEKDRHADVCCMVTRREKAGDREDRLFSCAAAFVRQERFGEATLLADDLFRTSRNAARFQELGSLCAAMAKPVEARAMLEKALAIDPTCRDARELLAALLAAGAS